MNDQLEGLSLSDVYNRLTSNTSLSLLYPDMSLNTVDPSLIQFGKESTLIDRYMDLPVRPFIKRIDLNECDDPDVKPSNAWFAGIEIKF